MGGGYCGVILLASEAMKRSLSVGGVLTQKSRGMRY